VFTVRKTGMIEMGEGLPYLVDLSGLVNLPAA
jgi:hypothetical protein